MRHRPHSMAGGDHMPHPLTIPNKEIFHYVQQRQLGTRHGRPSHVVAGYLAQQLPGLLQEREYPLGTMNKIFAAQWLSDRQVVFGTKCNKIIVLDTVTEQKVQIPSLKSSEESVPADCPCGIHSIAVNPSRTLLATGGENTNDLAVYRLPTFDPVCIGECGHNDWIFDICWLDDQFLATGSRDGKMCLWHVKDEEDCSTSSRMKSLQVPEYSIQRPVAVRMCRKAEKVRALCYNQNSQELVALSLNAYVHLWDVQTFAQKRSQKLSHAKENVCMAVSKDYNLYAVGSQSHVTFIDSRTFKTTTSIISQQRGSGIRSVSFNEEMVTIGTGVGQVYFYDLRNRSYLEMNCGHVCNLSVGKGWLLQDDTYRDFFMDQEYPNAIYAHCYDESGTKLFMAGGPLPAGLWGNYAGLWH